MVDLIVVIIILFYVLWGLKKGLGGILLDLLVLVSSAGFAWHYYRMSARLTNAIVIFLIASFVLTFLKWLFIKALKGRPKQHRPYLYSSNYILGANLGLVLGVIIVTLLFISIDIAPINLESWVSFKQTLASSKSYNLVKRLIPLNKIKLLENLKAMGQVVNNPELAEKLAELPEFKSLLKNESVKAISQDPEIAQQLKDKNYSELLKNPRVSQLLNDPEIIKHLLNIDYQKVLEEGN